MTAQVFTAVANRRAGTIHTYGYGHIAIDGTADTALANITTSSTISDVLEILDACIERDRTTTATSIGGATQNLTSNAPTDIALSAAALSTGANGSTTPVTVGTLSATSTDSPSNLTFSLVSGTGSTNNGNYAISGTTLQYTAGAASAGTQSVRVRVTDSASLTFEEAFTITIS
tara:strand:- start:13 stop:534 length:522 start_codon:yes stop_codon:yes gene_type:complete